MTTKFKNPQPVKKQNVRPKTKTTKPLIRFDWAMKRLLRQKANYTVLEGFLTVLLKESVNIINIKESETNRANANDKSTRVDIFVEDKDGELIIIEVQISNEFDYFFRMLYGVSKAITEHISSGEPYSKVRKVYHVNIVYFKLGVGEDYVYHGYTEFRGIHKNDILKFTEGQKRFFELENKKCEDIKDLFPEYYILCVEDFNDAAKDSLDEWIYYLKNNIIPDTFQAPGLKEARQQLQYDKLSEQEKRDYDHHLDQKLYERNTINTAIIEGEIKGEAKGLKKGLKRGLKKGLEKGEVIGLEKGEAIGLEKGEVIGRTKAQEDTIINSHQTGLTLETIAAITKLTIEQVSDVLKKHGV
jgi:predicted transposase/invertase (TIGR01784 family)